MYNLAIRKCTSPPLLAPRLKIYYLAGDRTPDLMNQRQTRYHLSQRSELEPKLIKHVIGKEELTAWENLLTFKTKDHIMNFYIPIRDALTGKFIIWPPDGSVSHPLAMVDVCS